MHIRDKESFVNLDKVRNSQRVFSLEASEFDRESLVWDPNKQFRKRERRK